MGVWSCAGCAAAAVHGVGWWCTPAAVVLAARWTATVVVLAVESTVAVYEVVLAMVPCDSMMDVLVVAPGLVGVMWSKIR